MRRGCALGVEKGIGRARGDGWRRDTARGAPFASVAPGWWDSLRAFSRLSPAGRLPSLPPLPLSPPPPFPLLRIPFSARAAAPLGMIQKYKRGASNYAEWEQWGYDILVTGVFAIIICGTLGLIAIHFLAPHLLLPAAPDPEAAEGSHRGDDELDPEGADADLRASGGDAKRGSEMVVQRTRSLPVVPSEPPLRRPAHDYELVALYIDTIRQLTTAATATNVDQKEVQRLSDAVMAIQSVRPGARAG